MPYGVRAPSHRQSLATAYADSAQRRHSSAAGGLHPVRVRRRLVRRYISSVVVMLAFGVIAVAVTALSARQAALGALRNHSDAQAFSVAYQSWFDQMSREQVARTGQVTALGSSPDGRLKAQVTTSAGEMVSVLASSDCMPGDGAGLGATVTVLTVPTEAAAPAMFVSRPDCLTPEDLAADPSAPQRPREFPVNWYVVTEAGALLGLIFITLGLRRVMRQYDGRLRLRAYGRRNPMLTAGMVLVVLSVLALPGLQNLADGISALLRRHGF